MKHINDNLLKIRYQINQMSDLVQLVAVSKYRSVDEITEAINAGQQIFGENRIQESLNKWPAIKEQFKDVKLHLIGPLQTNKVKDALKIFDVIEVVDRPKLAKALLKEMQRTNYWPDCLIQVNTGSEPQKAGILPEKADDFIMQCINEGLPIKGLMCIPPAKEYPIPHFTTLKKMADRHKLPIISMGMSKDYLQAIECGATHIRVGTAIFGAREKPK